MVILKKIQSATLVEALVATLLVVIIFVMASLVLNNLLLNTFSKNTHSVETRINELEYEIQNGRIRLPYKETYERWDIDIKIENSMSNQLVNIVTTDNQGKQLSRKRMYVK